MASRRPGSVRLSCFIKGPIEGRLHLTTKGTYVSGTESPDDQLTLAWDLVVDEPVVDQVGKK